MTLTTAQKATLKAAIIANPTWDAFPNNGDGNFDLAVVLNVTATPDFTVWKTSVPVQAMMDAVNGVSLAALQSAESNVLISVIASFQNSGIDPELPDKRDLFDNLFAGGANNNPTTRASLLALWKRLTTEGEKIFAVGTGSDAVPALLDFVGSLSGDDVESARNS